MVKSFHILVLLFCFSNVLSIEKDQFFFKNIDNKMGLSQNGVLTIFQDTEGYIWFGTHYGLNRFDGFNIKTFYASDNKNGLAGNDIQFVLQDSVQNIWIATSEGISIYNPDSKEFYNLKKFVKKESIFSQTILSMKLIDGKILVSSSEGLWVINPLKSLITEELAYRVVGEEFSYKLKSDFTLESIKIVEKDEDDNYWLIANNHVVSSKIIGDQLLIIDEIEIETNVNIELTALYKDNFSNFWIGTLMHGLYKMTVNKGKFSTVKVYPGENPKANFLRITDILQDAENNLWISSRGDGVIIIHKSDLVKNSFSPFMLSEQDLPSRRIKSIYKTRDNTMWLGSLGNGVFYYNNTGVKFTNYEFSDNLSENIVSYVRSISKDSYNRLWFGTLFEGLYIFDTEKQKIAKSLLKGKSVFELSEIDDNHFLAGCSDGLYLIFYDWASEKTEKIIAEKTLNRTVFSICNKANKYWIGTSKNILCFTLSDNYQISSVSSYESTLLLDSKTQNTIRCVKYDGNRNCLWIGGETSGLIKAELDDKDNITDFVSVNRQLNDSISIDNYICDIEISDMNNYWIGTRNGLVHLQLSKGGEIKGLQIFTTENGLPGNMIQSVKSDSENNLWIGTNRGLVKFDKASKKIVKFDIDDGIQDYEFAEHSSFQSEDGKMYFGGISGVSEFNPNKTIVNKFIEPAHILDVFINGESTNGKVQLGNTDLLSLSYMERNLRFNFITFNYINPLKCNYAYMLEGYDTDWKYTSAENRNAEYVRLPRGKYIFKVKASNEDNIWTKDYTSLPVEIKPSFWITYPAIIIYAFILLSLIFLVSAITKRRVQRKQKELLEKQYHEHIEKINQAKLQFFINISHEIRTPLTLIVCSVEKLIANLILNKKQEKEAAIIDRNVNRMLQLTNELLEIRKIETGNYQLNVRKNDIVVFLKNILFAFKSLATKLDIKLKFESYQPEVILWFDANALEKVFYNLISNAIKYTNNGGSVIIKVEPSKNPQSVDINVIDNGIGIDSEHLPKVFERFHHFGGNKDSYENGFGIGLSLTKSLVELHKASISVTSELNKGTCFTVCLSTSETLYSNDDKADKVIWKTDYSSVIEELKKRKLKDLKTEEPNYEIGTLDSDKAMVLFVDDNEELCENVSGYLSENYNVVVAPNGKIGYEMAKQNQPDVILSDIVMPEMDGFELCNKLKNDVVTSHIPVILLTAQGDSDSQFKGLETGADYFIPKPFDIKLLNLRIKNLIDSRDKLKKRFLSNQYSDAGEITTNSKDNQFMNKLLEHVNEHMAEPDLNINFIADKMAMSRSTFFRKMKAITGTTGKDFIDLVRLKKAAQLLTESDLNISEIAYDIGHSNPQYFSKWFKGYYKMSPSEYSLKHRKN